MAIEAKDSNDNSVVSLRSEDMTLLGAYIGDIMMLTSKSEGLFCVGSSSKKAIAICLKSDSVVEKHIQMNRVMKRNLGIQWNDKVSIAAFPEVQYATQVTMQPMARSIKGKVDHLDETYLRPYFQDAYRPIGMNEIYTIHGAQGDIEFKVVDTQPQQYGLVTPTTLITLNPTPLHSSTDED